MEINSYELLEKELKKRELIGVIKQLQELQM